MVIVTIYSQRFFNPKKILCDIIGKGLVTNYTDDQFDWAGGDEEDEDEITEKKRRKKQSGVILCLSRNSSYIAWSLLILVALVLIAIDVALFVVYEDTISWVSYNLQLWFTWAAFMWCLSMFLQLIVELVPWLIKRLVGILRPQSTEVLRMRLAVSNNNTINPCFVLTYHLFILTKKKLYQ